jgi:Holliday junction resolvase RusA-like endonuclease
VPARVCTTCGTNRHGGCQVSFFAYGLPAAQGSKRSIGNNRFVETSKNLPSWRAAVIEYAQKAYAGPPLDGALELTVTFWFPRPKSAKKGARWKTTAPDLDKLARGVGDALQIAGTIVERRPHRAAGGGEAASCPTTVSTVSSHRR